MSDIGSRIDEIKKRFTLFTQDSLESLRVKIVLSEVIAKFQPVMFEEIQTDEFTFPCPFHETCACDMIARNSHGRCFCNECGSTVDSIGYLMTAKLMTFEASVRFLAEMFNVKLEESQHATDKK